MVKKWFAALKTIRFRILVIVALCWLLPTMVLGVYMSSLFFDALHEKTEQALVSSATHAQEMTVQEIDRIIKKSKDVTYDEIIPDLSAQYLAGTLRYEDFYTSARNYWYRMFQRERAMDLTMFFLLEDAERPIYTADDVNALLTFQKEDLPYILEKGEKLDTQSQFVYVGEHLYHIRNLYSRKMERYGMVVLRIDPAEMLSPLLDAENMWKGQVDIILDEYQLSINAEKPFDAGRFRENLYMDDGDLCYVNGVQTTDYRFSYRIRLDESYVYGEINTYFQIIVALTLLLLPVEALIMLFIHFSLTRPLVSLADATQRLAKGELGITVPVAGMDEISRLGMAFNAMSLRMQNLIDKSYREELALRDARISALQSRINPHFLNNALELMNWQARMEGADTVSLMIESMSTLLNAALDRSEQRTVPLYTEVEVADAYFYFIQQRFGDRLQVEKIMDPMLRNAHVPRMIIQTLLENAVEHGIDPGGGGSIQLQIYRDEDMICIDVRNNGRQITDAEQEKINLLLQDTSRETKCQQVGIRNVNIRLKLIYNDRAGMSLKRAEDGYTVAHIYIPYDEAFA